MARTAIFLLFLVRAVPGAAQDTLHISATDAMRMGAEHGPGTLAAQLAVEREAERIKAAQLLYGPSINATASWRYNLELQETVLPADFGGSETVRFGTDFNTMASVSLDQPLIDLSLSKSVEIERHGHEMYQAEDLSTRRSASSAALLAWGRARRAEQLRSQALETVRHMRELLSIAEARSQQARSLEIDVRAAAIAVRGAELDLEVALNEVILADRDLRRCLGLPSGRVIALRNELPDGLRQGAATELSASGSSGEHANVQRLIAQSNAAHARASAARRDGAPSLHAFANYSIQQQVNDKVITGADWTDFSYLGVRLDVPLSGIVVNSNQSKQHRIEALRLETAAIEERTRVEGSAAEALERLRAAYELEVHRRSELELEVDRQALREAGLANGSVTLEEVIGGQNKVTDSARALANSGYDLIAAYAELLKWNR